jgi:hypothetical protein
MKKIFLSLILLLLLAGSSLAQKAKGDTLAGKWNGKWDPTDPLCPCYDIQKQAEKEYQQMLKKEQKNDTTMVQDKKQPDGSQVNSDNTTVNNNKTGETDVKVKQLKKSKRRSKSRERKYKRGKAVCPEI